MPALTLVKDSAPVEESLFRSVTNFVAVRVKLPAWSVAVLAVLAVSIGFTAGRLHPAHHYVSYFGYPMVMDTTTGKACYAVPPKPPATAQDVADPIEGTANALGRQPDSGPAIPLCGQEE